MVVLQIVWRSRVIVLLCMLLLALLAPAVAGAHPLGNFTVNRLSSLSLEGQQVRVRYIVDMAEIPALQERQQIDADQNGELSQSEQDRYRDTLAGTLAANLSLLIDQQPIALTLDTAALDFPSGQGGLPTLRLELELLGALPATGGTASFRDGNFADRVGWSEVVVAGLSGVTISESSAPTASVSDNLRTYPADSLEAPPSISTASFQWSAAPASRLSTDASPNSTGYPQVDQPDNLAGLITAPLAGPWGMLLALASAMGLGAAHALAPGHGKTIVAAYLVGTRGTPWHALFLGLTTTVTHTAGVFALGLLTLFVSRYILPEQLYPWLSALSGLMVALIGVGLLRQRLANVRGPQHQAEGMHSHGFGVYHSHAQPVAHGPRSTRSLLLLGISGGIIPCPSALIVLLAAVAAGQAGLGLLLVAAFSTGLAAVLTVIGLLLVYARQLFERVPLRSPALRYLPVASALVITIAGGVIAVQAIMSI